MILDMLSYGCQSQIQIKVQIINIRNSSLCDNKNLIFMYYYISSKMTFNKNKYLNT